MTPNPTRDNRRKKHEFGGENHASVNIHFIALVPWVYKIHLFLG
ncbi:hypothetical protein Thpro_023101 [Acidihalobacter prosperus]|uniref:Uncharacterized protein n=1 Tax=Acidihalobacter prosperus TaxID=160660 RepID=A0A1A6C2R1_9GAMM|nr:hypothetical protein Thpro_023101 [Acidihalobacter prosperus]